MSTGQSGSSCYKMWPPGQVTGHEVERHFNKGLVNILEVIHCSVMQSLCH